jgi:hypothetical protein
MSKFNVVWYREDKRVLLCEFIKIESWDDFYEMVKLEFAMLDTISHKVHIIFNIREASTSLPRAIPNLKHILELVHPNERVKIVVNAPTMFQVFYNVVHKVYKGLDEEYRFVRTMAEADRVLDDLLSATT